MAGHASIATTQRYMHVAPANLASAIRLLDRARAVAVGETLEKVVSA
jgi:hypothetical protein